MVQTLNRKRPPFGLVVTGDEAESWLPVLDQLIGPRLLTTYRVASDHELLEGVGAGWTRFCPWSSSPRTPSGGGWRMPSA